MGKEITKAQVIHVTPVDGKTVKIKIATGGSQPALWGVFLDGATVKKGRATPKTVTVGKASDLHDKTIEVNVITHDQDDSSDLISATIEIEGVAGAAPYSEEHDSTPDAWLSLNALYILH